MNCSLYRCAYNVHNYDAQQHRAGQIISPSYPPDNHHSSDVVCWRGGIQSLCLSRSHKLCSCSRRASWILLNTLAITVSITPVKVIINIPPHTNRVATLPYKISHTFWLTLSYGLAYLECLHTDKAGVFQQTIMSLFENRIQQILILLSRRLVSLEQTYNTHSTACPVSNMHDLHLSIHLQLISLYSQDDPVIC